MHENIDFDSELGKGKKTYEKKLGNWWAQRSQDRAHLLAYTKIAKFAKKHCPKEKSFIDYACGNGALIKKLHKEFPQGSIVGLDGSSLLLKEAKTFLPESIQLVKTHLPTFSLSFKADVVIFCFPNIVPDPKEQPFYDKHGYKNKQDVKVAKYLAKAREEDPGDETVTDDEDVIIDTLLTNKVISRSIHSLVKRDGYCIRVEYANAPRHELTKLVEARTAFEEGSLKEIDNLEPVQLFKQVACEFFKSKVIEDVYHQTGDEDDLEGGYFVTLLKAI